MSPLTTTTDHTQTPLESRRGRKRAPLTQARALATRERILNRALFAFARIGYDSASLTSDILQPAEVSVGSFYHQFDSKRHVFVELLQSVVAESRQAAIARVRAEEPNDLEAVVRQVLTTMFDDVDANPDVWRVQYRSDELNDEELRTLVASNLDAWNSLVADEMKRLAKSDAKRVTAATEITMALVHGLVRSYLAANDDDRTKLRNSSLPLAVDYAVGGVHSVLNA